MSTKLQADESFAEKAQNEPQRCGRGEVKGANGGGPLDQGDITLAGTEIWVKGYRHGLRMRLAMVA